MTSTDRVEDNFHFIQSQLKSIENFQPDLVCFPENSLYLNLNPKLDPTQAITLKETIWKELSGWAKIHQCFLHFGGVPLLESVPSATSESSEHKVFNAAVVVEPSGSVRVIYRKIHLFDVDVAGRVVRESDSLSAGSQPAIMDIKGWRVGMTICYDLRFSELFTHYHKNKVDLILVPSAFLVPTGRSHWNVLLRARAIETQSFVAAPAQVGVHRSVQNSQLPERQTWGESLLVGPWGEILAASSSFDQAQSPELAHKPLCFELDRAHIEKTRAQIPLLSHRRL